MPDVSTSRTIAEVLAMRGAAAPEAPAVLAPGRRPLTYGRLAEQVTSVVAHLNARGIGRSDRVAVVLPNGPDAAVAFLAVAAGATCAPLPDAWPADVYAFYLKDLDAKAVLLPAGSPSPVRTVAHDLGLPVLTLTPGPDAGAFALGGPAPEDLPDAVFAGPDDEALVLHTSGTTARPKLVPLTQANLIASARHHVAALALEASDRCLNVMPLTHIHGLVSVILSSAWAGASVCCPSAFDADRFLEEVEAVQATWFTASPAHHQAVLAGAADRPEQAARTSLRFIRSAAAPLPAFVLEALERTFGVPVIEAYGMTEAAAQICSNPLPPARRVSGSVGRAAGPEVAVVAPDGTLLPAGRRGEVVIRGANVMRGYAAPATANAEAFVDGWFRTGDLGVLDEAGYLFLQGRRTELINRGGKKVAPRAVDDALLAHPAVAEAVTFAVPHRTLGEDVAAAVVLHPGADADAPAIRAGLFDRLAEYMVPSRLVIVASLPRTAAGKPQRHTLADRLADVLQPEHHPPRTPMEHHLARLWSSLLDVPEPGLQDNFFALGGDSLTGMKLANRLRATLGADVPIDGFFEHPTLEAQARWVAQCVERSA